MKAILADSGVAFLIGFVAGIIVASMILVGG